MNWNTVYKIYEDMIFRPPFSIFLVGGECEENKMSSFMRGWDRAKHVIVVYLHVFYIKTYLPTYPKIGMGVSL